MTIKDRIISKIQRQYPDNKINAFSIHGVMAIVTWDCGIDTSTKNTFDFSSVEVFYINNVLKGYMRL